jgi:membrane protease YdiL (CAAX protease family)
MTQHNNAWWRPDALLPAAIVVSPYVLNKLIYIYYPGYLAFLATDYAVRAFSLALVYLLLRKARISWPIPWRLAIPSGRELLTALVGTIVLILSNAAAMTPIRYLNNHSWRLTGLPLPDSALLFFDRSVGMIFVGLSEEVVFCFYLLNLLLVRGMSPAMAIPVSTLIFAGIHWSYGAGTMVFAAFAGLLLAAIYVSTRNLIVPTIVHAAFDAVYFFGGVAFLWRSFKGLT